jgi:hypothetical protein
MNRDRLPLFCDTALAERIESVEAELIAKASEAAERRRTATPGFVMRAPRRPHDRRPLDRTRLSAGVVRERARPCPRERPRASDPTGGRGPPERRRRVRTLARRRGGWRRPPRYARGALARGLSARACPEGRTRFRGRGRHTLRRAARRSHGRRRQLPRGGGGRAAHRRGDCARPPPPRCPERIALGPLADAAAAGCDIAVVTTQPASKSQQNVQRRGFDLLYTRAVLERQP